MSQYPRNDFYFRCKIPRHYGIIRRYEPFRFKIMVYGKCYSCSGSQAYSCFFLINTAQPHDFTGLIRTGRKQRQSFRQACFFCSFCGGLSYLLPRLYYAAELILMDIKDRTRQRAFFLPLSMLAVKGIWPTWLAAASAIRPSGKRSDIRSEAGICLSFPYFRLILDYPVAMGFAELQICCFFHPYGFQRHPYHIGHLGPSFSHPLVKP